MNLITFCIDRPVSVIMFFVGCVIFGIIALTRLDIDILPPVQYPELSVITLYGGASPSEVESLITKQIEETIGGVSGIKRIYSESIEGASLVKVVFEWGTDLDLALINLREKVDQAKGILPQDVEKPIVAKFNPSSRPIMELTLDSEKYDSDNLKYIAEKKIKPFLERINGIGNVKISGGRAKEITISLDSQKLYAYGLSINDVKNKIMALNYNLPAGYINSKDKEILIRTIGEFKSVDEINDTIIKVSEDGAFVRLSDIGTAVEAYEDISNIAIINGKKCIGLSLVKETGKNTVKVCDDVFAEIDRLKEKYKGEINFEIHYDGSNVIRQAVSGVAQSAVLGAIIASIVIFLFLRNPIQSAVIAIVIPSSLIITIFFMYLKGISINIMSLGGLALGTGMLVDNGIVINEAVNRQSRKIKDFHKAVLAGVEEVNKHLLASMMTTLVVFLPMLFIKGIIGLLFFHLAFTISIAQIVAYFMSITFQPAVLYYLHKRRSALKKYSLSSSSSSRFSKIFSRFDSGDSDSEGNFSRYTSTYVSSVKFMTGNRFKITTITSAIVGITIFLGFILKVDFLPEIDSGYFIVHVKAGRGTPINETEKIMRYVDEIVSRDNDVGSRYARIGYNPKDITEYFGRSKSRATGELHVFLAEGRNISTKEFIDKIKTRLVMSEDVQVEYEEVNAVSSIFDFVRNTSSVNLIAGNEEQIEMAAGVIRNNKEILKKYSIDMNVFDKNDEAMVSIDKKKMASYNIMTEDTAATLTASIKGDMSGYFFKGDDQIPIRIRLERVDRKNIEDVKNILIKNVKGELITLQSFSDVIVKKGYQKIIRENQKRIVPIKYQEIKDNIINDLAVLMKKSGIPDISFDYPSEYFEIKKSTKEFLITLVLSVILVYMVLASQFESLSKPFLIMAVIPLSAVGVFVSLLLSGNGINVVSVMGMIMLVGIVVNNAIVLLGKMDENMEEGLLLNESISNACEERFKPILMTAISTVLGDLPLAIGSGRGDDIQTPLGITVIGGFIFSTFIVLYLLPAFYFYLHRVKRNQ